MGKIYAADWNPLQTTIANVMGAPNGVSYGWDKAASITSGQVDNTLTVQAAHYNKLRADINYCYQHIAGVNSSLVARIATTQITQADLTNVSTAVDYVNTNKAFAIAANLTNANLFSDTQSYTWTATLGATYTISWPDATTFKAFWNAGGGISFNMSLANGATNSQNQSWTNLLANMGFIYFKAASNGQNGQTWTGTTAVSTGISGLTTSYQEVVKVYDQDANYTPNYIRVGAYLNAAIGTATQLNIVILLVDDHVPTGAGPDTINGNVALTIRQFYPYTYAASSCTAGSPVLT